MLLKVIHSFFRGIILLVMLIGILALFDVHSSILGLIFVIITSSILTFLLLKDLKDRIKKEHKLYFRLLFSLGFSLLFYLFSFVFMDPSNEELTEYLIDKEVSSGLEIKRLRDTYPFFEREVFFKFTNKSDSLEKVLIRNGYTISNGYENDYESPFWFPGLSKRKECLVYSKNAQLVEKTTTIYASKDSDKVYVFVLYW